MVLSISFLLGSSFLLKLQNQKNCLCKTRWVCNRFVNSSYKFYIYNKPSWIIINNNNGQIYGLNTEGSSDPDLPASDWMVYTNDKVFPNSDRYSYLIPYDKLKEYMNKGITDLIPLNVIFDGYFKKYINYGSQDDIGFFSDRNNRLGENSFLYINFSTNIRTILSSDQIL